MWLTILDYKNGEIIIEEVGINYKPDWEEYIQDKIGHSDECHMVSDNLNLKINEE